MSAIDTKIDRLAAAAGRLGPRRVRSKVLWMALWLLALPLLLVGVSALYELGLVRVRQRELSRVAEAAVASPADRARLAAAVHAVIARFDGAGVAVERAGSPDDALARSAVGAVGERLVGRDRTAETLDRADAALPPWPERAEVRAALAGHRGSGSYLGPGGETLIITVAEPLPGGGGLYLLAGSHRGIRRLALARRQLVELVLYGAVLALPLVLLFAWGLVRPIERLADGARRYPAAPLAAEGLLARRDEIGALARTLARMTEELDARRRAAAELGADIAHEFKNPLATIAASAELLGAGGRAPSPERVALVVGTIGGAVERLRRSIDELLRLLRIEQALPTEARAPVPIGELLHALGAEYRADPRAAGWTFDVEVTPEAAALAPPLNRARWTEMLRNLIENALVQPAALRRIVLAARVDGGALCTSVRDHGPGVAPENQARIFQRFFTQRPDGVPPGTGLGLPIVTSVAAAHGARVTVGSPPGGGAELVITLPL